MGAASRNKGARGEREAVKLLLGWLADAGIDADIHRNADQARLWLQAEAIARRAAA